MMCRAAALLLALLLACCCAHDGEAVFVTTANVTDATTCLLPSSDYCAFQQGLVYNAVVACNNAHKAATVDTNNDVTCVTQATRVTQGNATAAHTPVPSDVLASIQCGALGAAQCSQVEAQAVTQCTLCMNSGAGCGVVNGVAVECIFQQPSVLSTNYLTSITSYPPVCDYVDPTWLPSLDSQLQATACYWANALYSGDNALSTYIYWSNSVGWYNTVANGCGSIRDGSFPCNGNGMCTAGYTQSYCECNPGFTGQFCELPETEADSTCDCGVTWSYAAIAAISYPNGYTIMPVGASAPATGVAAQFFAVGTFEQAQYLCRYRLQINDEERKLIDDTNIALKQMRHS